MKFFIVVSIPCTLVFSGYFGIGTYFYIYKSGLPYLNMDLNEFINFNKRMFYIICAALIAWINILKVFNKHLNPKVEQGNRAAEIIQLMMLFIMYVSQSLMFSSLFWVLVFSLKRMK